jgi:hypothetical protein
MLHNFSYAAPFEPLGTDLTFLEVGLCRMVILDYMLEFDGRRLLLIDSWRVVFASSVFLLTEHFAESCWLRRILGGCHFLS